MVGKQCSRRYPYHATGFIPEYLMLSNSLSRTENSLSRIGTAFRLVEKSSPDAIFLSFKISQFVKNRNISFGFWFYTLKLCCTTLLSEADSKLPCKEGWQQKLIFCSQMKIVVEQLCSAESKNRLYFENAKMWPCFQTSRNNTHTHTLIAKGP